MLAPTKKSESGYGLYDDKTVETLQQILFFREFDMPPKEIKAVMENPALDRNQILHMQRKMLLAKKQRAERLISSIDAILKGENPFDSFAVREVVAVYSFVMKQLCQIKEEKGLTLGLAQYDKNGNMQPMIEEKYGEGASLYFAKAIESFYTEEYIYPT